MELLLDHLAGVDTTLNRRLSDLERDVRYQMVSIRNAYQDTARAWLLPLFSCAIAVALLGTWSYHQLARLRKLHAF